MENCMTPIPGNEGMSGVANLHGQTSDAYAYVWMVQGSLFSLITLWNSCHSLNRCEVAYCHGKPHDYYAMQWRNYSDYESSSICLYCLRYVPISIL